MGVGYPVDILLCACLGVDMFDCVFPMRTARFGTAFTSRGNQRLITNRNKYDFTPIDAECQCEACKNYTRAYFYQNSRKTEVACHLLSKHNILFNMTLMQNVRKHIREGNVEEFAREFVRKWFEGDENKYSRDNSDIDPDTKMPKWVGYGLKLAFDPNFTKDLTSTNLTT